MDSNSSSAERGIWLVRHHVKIQVWLESFPVAIEKGECVIFLSGSQLDILRHSHRLVQVLICDLQEAGLGAEERRGLGRGGG
jgi:hypothetical protein